MAKTGRPAGPAVFGVGWVGFVHSAGQVLSEGIAWLTRRSKKGGVTVTHAFVVTGPDECVEANLPAGVVKSSLSEQYLGREDRRVIFRKPRGLTAAAGRRVAARARAAVGAKFDFGGFAAEGLGDTFLGHLADRLLGGRPKRLLSRLLHQKGRYLCSALVAHCLRQEPRYRNAGVLARAGIPTPQELFEDDELFEPPAPGREGRPATRSTAARSGACAAGSSSGTAAQVTSRGRPSSRRSRANTRAAPPAARRRPASAPAGQAAPKPGSTGTTPGPTASSSSRSNRPGGWAPQRSVKARSAAPASAGTPA